MGNLFEYYLAHNGVKGLWLGLGNNITPSHLQVHSHTNFGLIYYTHDFPQQFD
jgi:hypothetical protein